MKRILIIIPLFYVLVLLQTSFLNHFGVFSGGFKDWAFNLILIAVILINLFEGPEENFGILSAFLGGFFLDIFSEHFIGFYVLILIGLALFIKLIFKRYVRIPIIERI